MLSAPQSNRDTTFSKFNAFMHLVFKYFIWGINDNLLSNITQRNLCSWTTGMAKPFNVSVGSWCSRFSWGRRKGCHGWKKTKAKDNLLVTYPWFLTFIIRWLAEITLSPWGKGRETILTFHLFQVSHHLAPPKERHWYFCAWSFMATLPSSPKERNEMMVF